jgi:hypothetical protein
MKSAASGWANGEQQPSAGTMRDQRHPSTSIGRSPPSPRLPLQAERAGAHTVTINFTSCCEAMLTERLRRGWRWSRQGCLGEARCEENAVRADAT